MPRSIRHAIHLEYLPQQSSSAQDPPNLPLNPPIHHLRNLNIILLHKNKMCIPMYPLRTQIHPLCIHTPLQQIPRRAPIIPGMKTRLARNNQHRHLRHVHQLPRRLSLQETILQPRVRRRCILYRREIHGWVYNGWIVGYGNGSEAVGTGPGTAAGGGEVDDAVLEGRALGLEEDHGFYEGGARVGGEQAEEAALRVADPDYGLVDTVEEGGDGAAGVVLDGGLGKVSFGK